MTRAGKKFQKAEQARRAVADGAAARFATLAAAAGLLELPGALGGAGQEVRLSSNG